MTSLEICPEITYNVDLLVPNPEIPYYFYRGGVVASEEDLGYISDFNIVNYGKFYNSGKPDSLLLGIRSFFASLTSNESADVIEQVANITYRAIKQVTDIFDFFNQDALVIIKASPQGDKQDDQNILQVHADPCFEYIINENYMCEDKFAVSFTLAGQPTYYFNPTLEQALAFDKITGGEYDFEYSNEINTLYNGSVPQVAKVGQAMVFKIGPDGAHHAVPSKIDTQRIWVGVFPIDPEYRDFLPEEELEYLLQRHRKSEL